MPKTKAAKRKTEFWWASIAGAKAEPIEKTTVDGRPAVYTCGCADPFFLDETDCVVELILLMERVPLIMADEFKAPKKGLKSPTQRYSNTVWHAPDHGWRGPR